jgi:hypothetical protein
MSRHGWRIARERISRREILLASLFFGIAMNKQENGVIRADEAYSKHMVLERLGISQKFWDKMLDEGLPYTIIGHTRWVTGQALIEHLSKNAERKNHEPLQTQ